MSLPTLGDLKAHLDMDVANNKNDAELTDMLDAAVDVVEGIVGPITAKTVTETHRVNAGELVLRRFPVADLVSVTQFGAEQSVGLFEVDADSGIVRRGDGYGFVGSFTVTYSAGRPTLPASIRLAILIVAGHLWDTQRGTSPSALALQDPDAGFGAPSVAGYAIPNRARDLLARYVQPTLA